MNPVRSAMLCLAMVAVAIPARAQVVTREITQQPVETIVTRFPDQTIVTRRPLPPAGTIGIEPGVAPAYTPYGTVVEPASPAGIPAMTETVGAPVTARPVVPEAGTRSVRTITIRQPAVSAPDAVDVAPAPRPVVKRTAVTRSAATRRAIRPHTAGRPQTVGAAATRRLARHTATRAIANTPRATRTAVRRTAAARSVGRPLVLTPTQRRTIYRSVVEQQVIPAPRAVPASTEVVTYPGAPIGETVVTPAVTTGYPDVYPAAPPPGDVPAAAVTYPSTYYASAGYPVTYTIGSVVPASVPRAVLPQSVMVRVPQTQAYQYVVVNNRVLLIDPATGTVVADVTP